MYDAESRLSSANGVSYSYDGDGRRVKKSSGTLYWYGTNSDPIAETDASGNTQNEYIYFGGKRVARQDSSNNTFYYFSDELGTARGIIQSGSTSPCYDADFYPFGGERTVVDTCDSHYKFTGKERDPESGLDNFGARYDSSQFGRFMTPDWSEKPMGVPYAQVGDPQSLNLYSYVQNNPLSRADPDGHCALCAGIQDLIASGMDSSDALVYANRGAAMSAISGITTMLTPMMAPGSEGSTTPFNPAVTYDKNLSANDLTADQTKVGGAVGAINSNWSKLSDQEKTTIGGIKSIDVSGSAQRSYVRESTGKLTLTQDYVSKSSTAWLASAIAHDAEHVALFKSDGIAASRGIPAEVKAMQFQLQVGVKFGLSAFEVRYLQGLIQNPSQLQRYIDTPP